MIAHGYKDRIQFSCNMRFGALTRDDYRLIKKAGFRMLLFGVESGSQATLDRLNKGTTIEGIVNECKVPREEGLEPHITIMVGYPWETRKDALSTLNLAKMLMEKGWAITLQSTLSFLIRELNCMLKRWRMDGSVLIRRIMIVLI